MTIFLGTKLSGRKTLPGPQQAGEEIVECPRLISLKALREGKHCRNIKRPTPFQQNIQSVRNQPRPEIARHYAIPIDRLATMCRLTNLWPFPTLAAHCVVYSFPLGTHRQP